MSRNTHLLSLIDAQPSNLGKKGADRGHDGRLYYGKTGHGIVSAKAGENVGASMIRDLKGVIEREKARVGVFLTLTEPTKPMITEAASAALQEEHGFAPVPAYRSSPSNRRWPCANAPSASPLAAKTPSNARPARKTPPAKAPSTRRVRIHCAPYGSGPAPTLQSHHPMPRVTPSKAGTQLCRMPPLCPTDPRLPGDDKTSAPCTSLPLRGGGSG
jgi:hypothetical protein